MPDIENIKISPKTADIYGLYVKYGSLTTVSKLTGLVPSAIKYHVDKVIAAGGGRETLVEKARSRIADTQLEKSIDILGLALDEYRGTERSKDRAVDVATNHLKGMGVYISKSDTAPAPINIEDMRIQVIERLNIASQFGGHVPPAIQAQAEIITDTEPNPPVPEADQTVEDDDNTLS